MFENLTLDQLAELRGALWLYYDAIYEDHCHEIQALEIGSAEMSEAFRKWEVRRDNIKAMQAAAAEEFNNRAKEVLPPVMRRRRN